MVNRTSEVLNDRSITRFASYILPEPKYMKDLQEGYDLNDSDKMLSAIEGMSMEAFIKPLLAIDPYTPAIKELAKKIMDNNSRYLTEENKGKATGGLFKPEVKPLQQRTHHTFIMQFNKRDGKEYKRVKPERFTQKQTTFLVNRQNEKNKDLVEAYNNYFPGERRTESSIITQKYRIKKQKLTPAKWRKQRQIKRRKKDDKKIKKFDRQ